MHYKKFEGGTFLHFIWFLFMTTAEFWVFECSDILKLLQELWNREMTEKNFASFMADKTGKSSNFSRLKRQQTE